MVECQQPSNSALGCNPIRRSPAFLKARLVGGFKFIPTNLFICPFTGHLGKWHVLFRKENERILWALFYVFRLTPTVSCQNAWMLVEPHSRVEVTARRKSLGGLGWGWVVCLVLVPVDRNRL